MNNRVLQRELMKAIIRSSSLTYEDVFPLVVHLLPTVTSVVTLKEREVAEREEKKEREKKNKGK